jgi:hypothetical protein
VGRTVRAVLGLILAGLGSLLFAGTTGLLALDAKRLADLWPLVFVVVGLLVVLDAWVSTRHTDMVDQPSSMDAVRQAQELQQRLELRLDQLTPGPPAGATVADPVAPPTGGHATDERESPGPQAEPALRQAAIVAALLELQGLRRHRLISKREYRAMRAELVARMYPWPRSGPDEVRLGGVEGAEAGPPAAGVWPGRPPG